jgi:hypothetical protein
MPRNFLTLIINPISAMAKTATKTPKKATKAPAKPKATVSAGEKIEVACETAFKKLQALGIEQQLQSEMEWCLGSYRHDNNPTGLYQMVERAITVFQSELTKKTKGVTAKLISDLEKALK